METLTADTIPSVASSDDSLDSLTIATSSSSDSGSTLNGSSTVSNDHTHSSYGPSDLKYFKWGVGRWGSESYHSSTYLSSNSSGYTGYSYSHGTSQMTGEASTLSTVSIKIEKFKEFFEDMTTVSDRSDDSTTETSIEIISTTDSNGTNKFGTIGGL